MRPICPASGFPIVLIGATASTCTWTQFETCSTLIAEEEGDEPVDALAISLSSEFLARVAVEKPKRIRSLAFVTPTGFDRRSQERTARPGASREVPGMFAFLRIPVLNQGLFNLLVSERGIRFFLEKTFGSKDIDEGLAHYDYMTAHQPGARYAPFAFVSGRLFSTDIPASISAE